MKKNTSTFTFDWLVITLIFIACAIFLWSLISIFASGSGRMLLVLATGILLVSFIRGEPGFLKNTWSTFRKSFSHLRANVIFIIICDVLLVLAIAGIIIAGGRFLETQAESVKGDIDLMKVIQQESPEMAAKALDTLKDLLGTLLATFAIMLFTSVFLYSLFKGFIWYMSYHRLPKVKNLFNYFLLNLFWLPVITLIAFILAIAFKEEFASVLLIIYLSAAIHATIILSGVFVHKGTVWSSISGMFRIAFFKMRYFIIPYIVIILLVLLIVKLSYVLGVFPPTLVAPIMVVIVLPFLMAFGRIYIAQVIKEQLS